MCHSYFYHIITLVFILFFIVFSFLSLSGIKNNFPTKQVAKKKLILLVTLIIIPIYFLFYYYSLGFRNDGVFYGQIFLILVFPIILVLSIWKARKNVFIQPVSRIKLIIIIFGFVSLLLYYQVAIESERVIPEIKILLPFLIIAIPLGISGFENLLKNVIYKFRKSNLNHLILIIMLLVFGVSSLIELSAGYNFWLTDRSEIQKETEDMKLMHEWLRENLSHTSIVASDLPPLVFYETGQKSLPIPVAELRTNDLEKLEYYFDKWNVSHIVFYWSFPIKSLDAQKINSYYYEKIYDSNTTERYRNYVVYEITNILKAENDNPKIYALKAKVLKDNGRDEEAIQIYRNLLGSNDLLKIDPYLMYQIHYSFGEYNEALNSQIQIIETKKTSEVTLFDLEKLLDHDGLDPKKTQKLVLVLKNEEGFLPLILLLKADSLLDYSVLDAATFDTKLVKLYRIIIVDKMVVKVIDYGMDVDEEIRVAVKNFEIISELIDSNLFLNDYIVNFNNEAKFFEKSFDFQNSLKSYSKVLLINKFDLDAAKGKTRVMIQLGDEDIIINYYDNLFKIYEVMLKSSILSSAERKVILMDERETQFAYATFLINYNKISKAEHVYFNLLGDDKYDFRALKGLANLYEKMNLYEKALIYYKKISPFELDNQVLSEKIKQLETKIRS